jgi:colanic acid/amylovoran biosynthesis glycosyltransferase
MSSHTLLVIPSLDIGRSGDGRLRLTQKFIGGMALYVDRWDGPVEVLAEQNEARESGNLDDVWVRPDELSFRVTVTDFKSDDAKAAIRRAAVVQGGADHRLNHMPALCAAMGVRYVFVCEYTFRTRRQIIDADAPIWPIAWRRKAWAWRQERANLACVRMSAALQCNGTPTFEAYRSMNERTLLYFDSRVASDMLPLAPRLLKRTQPWCAADPIRLAFSGRLNRMKGADHLLLVASALRDLNVPFTMDIYGDGPLTPKLHKAIRREGLGDQVRLRGVVDFATELMPAIRDQVDVFVCCHRQGDPSCTYLETMACGVPIVGYANEAFAGLMSMCRAGEVVPMDDWAAMAATIARLSLDPRRLGELALCALAFAKEHTFEQEFQRRIEHMRALVAPDQATARLVPDSRRHAEART